MFHSSRHDDALSGLQLDGMIPEPHPELAFPDHEELVFVVVMMPGELAAHLDDLDVLPVEEAMIFGRQCSSKRANFSLRDMRFICSTGRRVRTCVDHIIGYRNYELRE